MNGSKENKITLRDQRKLPWYTIDHAVMLEWCPIIGRDGYALYSLYVCLAAVGATAPGLRKLGHHLGMSTKSVFFYNRILEWAGLIEITSGDVENPNIYNILDVPPVTPEAIENIRVCALEDSVMGNNYADYFLKNLLKSLENWQPFWQPMKPEDKRHEAKGHPETTPHPTLIEDDTTTGRLLAVGFGKKKSVSLLEQHEPDYLEGWIAWATWKQEQEPVYFKNLTGYLLRVWNAGDPPPEIIIDDDRERCRKCGEPNDNGTYCNPCLQDMGVRM